MRDLVEFFERMNSTDFKYVVLRNWEHLPYSPTVGEHSDLDILVYDREHFYELFEGEITRVHPHPRVQFKLPIGDSYTFLDVRYLGDNYYPYQFEENILKTREWNPAGFWTPNPIHFRLALAYHAVHHKNGNNYVQHIGNVSVGKMLEALKQSEIGWVEPDDPSVGRFNAYLKGATAVVSKDGETVEKTQYRYKDYDLIENEKRILSKISSVHFPKLISSSEDSIRIEFCGEPLSPNNLPDDWKEQFREIIAELRRNNIVHRDIRLDNFMVKDGVIKLIDFGWARFSDEEDGKFPDLLGYPNKCPNGFNDEFSMRRVIKGLETELEELCEYSA